MYLKTQTLIRNLPSTTVCQNRRRPRTKEINDHSKGVGLENLEKLRGMIASIAADGYIRQPTVARLTFWILRREIWT